MAGARVLLIDNVDSFTLNVADLLHRVLGEAPVVWQHDHPATAEQLRRFAAVVVGPGPGRPQHPRDMGLSDVALRQREVPVLGVCLGHQGLAHVAGDQVVELAEPVHGRVSQVRHVGDGLFAGVPSPLAVVRYHSLEARLAPGSVLRALAWAEDDGSVMALADPSAPRWGVQFHPESVLSEHGERIVRNFLGLAGVLAGESRADGPRHRGPADSAQPAAVRSSAPLQPPRSVLTPPHPHPHPPRPAARRVTVEARAVSRRVDTWWLHDRLVGEEPTSFWLDSSAGARSGAAASDAARFSVIGDASGPLSYRLTHRVGQGTTVHRTAGHGGSEQLLRAPLLDNLAELLGQWDVVGDVDLPTGFRPGFVGYLGYELKAETGGRAAHRSPHPDAWLVFADRAVVVDHHAGTVHAVYLCDDEVAGEQRAWAEGVLRLVASGPTAAAGRAVDPQGAPAGWPTTAPWPTTAEADRRVRAGMRHTEPEYLRLVQRCQEQIRAGETYEICLTTSVRWPDRVEEATAYRLLREVSPVPHGAWLHGPELSVLGASPERFVSVSAEGAVQARPIKGTRPRHEDPVLDAALADELATAVKDRAENLMIVDLLRHDLHRVCRPGSVHVPELFAVERYATVHQLVSTIEGRLEAGMTALDVLDSCFPGGSMTGAPKVRTMEILDAVEGAPRGPYSGALGWIGVTGAMDTSIVIRTATWVDGWVEMGVGGAVTALSDPEEEVAEAVHKARALAATLTAAAGAGRNTPTPPRVDVGEQGRQPDDPQSPTEERS